MTRIRWLPGLTLAVVGATAGYGVHLLLPGLPWLTAALILGVLAGSIPPLRHTLDGALAPGLALAGRRLLRLGIVVLGLKLSLVDIARLGWVAILAIVVLVAASFGITWLVCRLFHLEGDQAVLMAAGFSICGVSAVGAMAAARRSRETDTGTPITLVTLYGTLAIVVLPALASLLRLDNRQFGHWVGASVHDVGQVVATAQTAGAVALAVAVVVKLTRVLMLAPIVAIASIQTRRRDSAADASLDATPDVSLDASSAASSAASSKRPPIVPLFILGFVAAVLVRSLIPLPDALLASADVVQSALLATALFGIGASLRLEQLARSGLRALAAGLVSWVATLGLGLAVVFLS
ncbi:YeiH family protein [Frigoribacterium sp. CG_9.8]|uniref:YeiH family protein n=1 Tax=Frigoribacterium sp. CG_9.8 TaxID=2787733 RepID=UPI0018CBE01F|nr:putative sulfate exporter family transporter [Frigoribacterium sp. CG_9.8]MBG6106883.1 putative integral membrane protein (TIGR00698 family) [Frigoribacterium sp. CG_9.8]